MASTFVKPIAYFKNIINSGNERSVLAKKNIIITFLIKGVSIGISLIVVPITINYINPSKYGIWLTLSSIVSWFAFFDIGLTHGLRNKFAEAKAKDDHASAQMYVSTTYAVLGIIFTLLWVFFLVVNHFLNWANLLKIPQGMSEEISVLSLIVFTYFCLQFVLKIITTIAIADQKPATSSLIDLIGQFISLIAIIILVKTTKGSLIDLGLALCISPILSLFGANLFLFKEKYKQYRPSLSKINFVHAKGLFNLGFIFFVIQITGVVQYETADIIIARNFGTSDVTSYNIVYKYFSMLTMLFTIFIMPFWSASTEAYLKGDYKWIRDSIKKYNILNLLLFVLGIIMLILSDKIYTLWLGKDRVLIDFQLSLWGFLFIIILIFGTKYVVFLNGISALRLQFWICLVSPLVFIATAFIFIKYYHMGVYSLFIASIVANLNGIIIAPIQYYQIIIKNKKGIWTK